MEATRKRKTKKLAKTFGILAWTSLFIWITEIVVLIIVRDNTEGEWDVNLAAFLTAFLLPLFLSLIFVTFSQGKIMLLKAYMGAIKEYRVRRAFHKFMDYITAGDLEMALTIYNGYIPEKHMLRSYSYSVLIVLMSQSDDPELRKKGQDKVSTMLDFYDPDRVNLDVKF